MGSALTPSFFAKGNFAESTDEVSGLKARRGGALMTSGDFKMMSSSNMGNFAESTNKLEDVGGLKARRGGGALMTSGDFKMMSSASLGA